LVAAERSEAALGETPRDYDRHFILTADIDLGSNPRDRRVFDQAVIAPDTDATKGDFQGTPFTGVFDGNGYVISHLSITGVSYVGLFGYLDDGAVVMDVAIVEIKVVSLGEVVGGLVGLNEDGQVTGCFTDGVVDGIEVVGGLAGLNDGVLTRCYSTARVMGRRSLVGGLVGLNWGSIISSFSAGTVSGEKGVGGLAGVNAIMEETTDCYSTGAVNGEKEVGGLVGRNDGDVTRCYSTGAVSGAASAGGLIGHNDGSVVQSFWDAQSSGRYTSAGGTRLTTAEMQGADPFLSAGWDLMGETKNGREDIWYVSEQREYPRLWWEYWACSPHPQDGAAAVTRWPVLEWHAATMSAAHDLYFGNEESVVASATTQTQGVYQGRYPGTVTAYDPGILDWTRTYYWRIDEINDAEPDSPWKGKVWSFTTGNWMISCHPSDGATVVGWALLLSWVPGGPGLQYDVYFGADKDTVANATPDTGGVYRGRQPSEITTYEPDNLRWGMTYYWRVDGVDETDPQNPWKGEVWSFTTQDFLVSLHPPDDATDVPPSPILSWVPSEPGKQYDVYFGEDEETVANATPASPDLYQGRQPADEVIYEPGALEVATTYYWRVDEVNETDPGRLRMGKVRSFTTVTFDVVIVIDDFESYGNEMGSRVFETWIDAIGFQQPAPGHPGNGTGGVLGHDIWNWESPYIMETKIVHGGRQSVPYYYYNSPEPYYAEVERTFTTPSYWTPESIETPQDWTADDADTLTLYFHGEPNNHPQPLYVTIEDSAGGSTTVIHPDPNAVTSTQWRAWHMALVDLQAEGVSLKAVRKMIIGIGDCANPQPGGTGLIYIDDIWVTKWMP